MTSTCTQSTASAPSMRSSPFRRSRTRRRRRPSAAVSVASRSPTRSSDSDRLLEPPDVVLGRHALAEPQRLLAAIATVGVHVELDIVAHHTSSQGHPAQVPRFVGARRLGDLDLHPGDAELVRPAGELVAGRVVIVGGEPAAAVDRRLARQRPNRSASATPSRRALGPTARSTAEIAQPTTPGRPRLRHLRTIASCALATSRALPPSTAGASSWSTMGLHAAVAYVEPRPDRPPPSTSTTTTSVADHASVPSASGRSVETGHDVGRMASRRQRSRTAHGARRAQREPRPCGHGLHAQRCTRSPPASNRGRSHSLALCALAHWVRGRIWDRSRQTRSSSALRSRESTRSSASPVTASTA